MNKNKVKKKVQKKGSSRSKGERKKEQKKAPLNGTRGMSNSRSLDCSTNIFL